MDDIVPTGLDPAQAASMVATALDAARIDAGETARQRCAKTLLRLQPAFGAPAGTGDFDAALQDIGRD
jgi:hypothetical protein